MNLNQKKSGENVTGFFWLKYEKPFPKEILKLTGEKGSGRNGSFAYRGDETGIVCYNKTYFSK